LFSFGFLLNIFSSPPFFDTKESAKLPPQGGYENAVFEWLRSRRGVNAKIKNGHSEAFMHEEGAECQSPPF